MSMGSLGGSSGGFSKPNMMGSGSKPNFGTKPMGIGASKPMGMSSGIQQSKPMGMGGFSSQPSEQKFGSY